MTTAPRLFQRGRYPVPTQITGTWDDLRDGPLEVPGTILRGPRGGVGQVFATHDAAQILVDDYQVPGRCPVEWIPNRAGLRHAVEEAESRGFVPYKHQRKTPRWLTPRGGAILADEMRLGKSVSAIMSAIGAGAERVLITCPAVAKLVWANEIRRFLPDDLILVLAGRRGERCRFFGSRWHVGVKHEKRAAHVAEALSIARWVILTPDILTAQHKRDDAGVRTQLVEFPGYGPLLMTYTWDVYIADEPHGYLRVWERGVASKRRAVIRQLADPRRTTRSYATTGTPTTGKVKDYWGIMDVLQASWGQKPFTFQKRYCDAHHAEIHPHLTKRGIKPWVADGESNAQELSERRATWQLRRTRIEVAPDMPPKIRTINKLDLPPGSTTKINAGNIHDRARSLTAIKAKEVMSEIVEEACTGRKVVVYFRYRTSQVNGNEMIAKQIKKLPKWKSAPIVFDVHGGTPPDRRVNWARGYVEHAGGAIWCATIESMPGAISLRGCDTVHFLELHHDPVAMLQAEDRGYELGTGGMTVIYWVVERGVDRHMADVLIPKLEVLDRHVGSQATESMRQTLNMKPQETIDEMLARIASDADIDDL